MGKKALSPAESGKFIASEAKHVKIILGGLNKLADEIILTIKNGKIGIPSIGYDELHPQKDDPNVIDWIFLCDTLNFCFWGDGEAKWEVNGHSGYNALAAALQRAIKDGVNIADPYYYSQISIEEFKHLMRGDNIAVEIPLLNERVKILHDTGNTLITRYNGKFKNCLIKANNSAVKLLELVTNDFESFRDVGVFNDTEVSFYKRAQILIADIWNCFGGEGLGRFYDIKTLTMFADYRVPQVLLYFGALEYDKELYDKLNNGIVLKNGCLEEMEIRGCSIHAIQILRNIISKKLSNRSNVELPNAISLDFFLWCYRRKYSKELKDIPYHKVLGIYY